jgi:hypothetical protein
MHAHAAISNSIPTMLDCAGQGSTVHPPAHPWENKQGSVHQLQSTAHGKAAQGGAVQQHRGQASSAAVSLEQRKTAAQCHSTALHTAPLQPGKSSRNAGRYACSSAGSCTAGLCNTMHQSLLHSSTALAGIVIKRSSQRGTVHLARLHAVRWGAAHGSESPLQPQQIDQNRIGIVGGQN